MTELHNPLLWAVVAGTLAYCGVLVQCARLGFRTASLLQSVSTAALWQRLVRTWYFWSLLAVLLFLLMVACSAANALIVAVLLMAPYTYFFAIGVFREGRV